MSIEQFQPFDKSKRLCKFRYVNKQSRSKNINKIFALVYKN